MADGHDRVLRRQAEAQCTRAQQEREDMRRDRDRALAAAAKLRRQLDGSVVTRYQDLRKDHAEAHRLLRAIRDYGDEPFVDEKPDGDGRTHVTCGLCGDTTEGCVNHDCPMPDVRKLLERPAAL